MTVTYLVFLFLAVPLSSLQGFNRKVSAVPASPSIPIGSAYSFPRKRPNNDFDMDEEMSDADSTVLGSSVTSEHDMLSSPKIPALMNTPQRGFIKTEHIGSPTHAQSTSFPPRFGSECLLRGPMAQPPHYSHHISSSAGISTGMASASPQAASFLSSFGVPTNTNYSTSLPTSMQRISQQQFSDFGLSGVIHAGSPPATSTMSPGWSSDRRAHTLTQMTALTETRAMMQQQVCSGCHFFFFWL